MFKVKSRLQFIAFEDMADSPFAATFKDSNNNKISLRADIAVIGGAVNFIDNRWYKLEIEFRPDDISDLPYAYIGEIIKVI